MTTNLLSRRTITGLAAVLALMATWSTVALAQGSSHSKTASVPKLIGNAKAGKALFLTTCAACHRLKAAGSVGTIGPNLDKVPMSEARLINAITNGGPIVMTRAQLARYTTLMEAYRGTLSKTKIQNIAAFVYTSTHK